MKGFIEVTHENECKILFNINCIEMVSPLSNGCAAIITTSIKSEENYKGKQQIIQNEYFTLNTYDEIKAKIAEAMNG